MAEKVIIDIEAKTGKAQANLEDVVKELKQLNEQAVKTNQDLNSGLKNVKDSAKNAGKSFLSFRNILKGAFIITALTKAFEFFKDTLGQNQTVVNSLNVATEFLSILFNDIIGSVINATSSFDNFKEAVSNLFNNFKTLLNPAFVRFQKLIKGAQLGLKVLFQPKDTEGITRLTEEMQELDKEFIQVKDEQKQLINGIKDYTKQTFSAAKSTVELNRNAEKAAAINQGLIESFDIQAEKLRQTRDEERNTIEQRIQANNDLKAVLEEQAETMEANAQAVVDAAQAQFDKNKNDANAIALQEAKNELMAVEAQVTGFMSEQKINDLGLERERLELEQANIDATVERQKLERDFTAEQIEDDVLRIQAQQKNLEIEKQQEEERLKNKRDSFTEGTQAFQDAENERLEFLLDVNQREIQLKKELSDAETKVEEKGNADKNKLAEENANNVSNALSQVASIVGANSKFGKGIAIASAIRDTYAGANKALAQGGIFGIIQAVAIIAAGLGNVKNITATDDPPTPSFASGGGAGSSGVSVPTPQAPAFNIVGSDPQNQLAQTLAETTSKPVKAFVVSSDVSTAQSLDRNIIEESSLG